MIMLFNKRLAHPQKHSPVLGLMSKYIVGLKELKEKLLAWSQKGQIDLKKFNIAGVKVVNNYEFEIKIYENILNLNTGLR